jgi:hypothetical protein
MTRTRAPGYRLSCSLQSRPEHGRLRPATGRAFAAQWCARGYDAHSPRDTDAASKRHFRRAPPLHRRIPGQGRPGLRHSAPAPRRKRHFEAASTTQRHAFIVVAGCARIAGPVGLLDARPPGPATTTNARHKDTESAWIQAYPGASAHHCRHPIPFRPGDRQCRAQAPEHLAARLAARDYTAVKPRSRPPVITGVLMVCAPMRAHPAERRARGRCGGLAALGHRALTGWP